MALVLTFLHGGLWLILLSNLWYLRQGETGRRASSTAEPTAGNPPGAASPQLSVLIPARNEERNLQRLLPSLLDQKLPGGFEVIVYDDGSSDGTARVLHAFEQRFQHQKGASLHVRHGDGPPAGWVGKTHALHQAAQVAQGQVFLFLDADAQLEDPEALRRLVRHFESLPGECVLTGFPRLRGAALLLVSIVPCAILTGLPWPLVHRTPRLPSLSALNGQCWMIEARTYRRYEPHRACKGDVLEDVEIGRFLKAKGHGPVMRDVRGEVSIFMYERFAQAWRGFRKNAYLLMGGTPLAAIVFIAFFVLTFVLAPFVAPWLWLSMFGLKAVTDWRGGLPGWISLLAPLSFLLAVAMQIDSTVSHLWGRVEWKGRSVESTRREAP